MQVRPLKTGNWFLFHCHFGRQPLCCSFFSGANQKTGNTKKHWNQQKCNSGYIFIFSEAHCCVNTLKLVSLCSNYTQHSISPVNGQKLQCPSGSHQSLDQGTNVDPNNTYRCFGVFMSFCRVWKGYNETSTFFMRSRTQMSLIYFESQMWKSLRTIGLVREVFGWGEQLR